MNRFIKQSKGFLGKQLNKVNMILQVIRLGRHRFANLLNLRKKDGKLICRNDFIFKFNKKNAKQIKDLFYFSLLDGVLFSNRKGYWNYKNNIITTPQGIKFDIKSFDELIFAETFLYDIHFSDLDLKNKVVVQAGGFTGDTALYYADRGAKVYSFEPDRNAYLLPAHILIVRVLFCDLLPYLQVGASPAFAGYVLSSSI